MVRQFTHYTSLPDAVRILRENVTIKPRIEVMTTQTAFGRVLSRDVIAHLNVPRFDSSHMDGFAVRAADLLQAAESNPIRLRLAGSVRTGMIPKRGLARGEAHKILTGGFLPKNADAVVAVERAVIEGDGVNVRQQFVAGTNVYKKGTDIKKGERLLSRGTVLRAQDIALLASLHVGKVPVYAKPSVGIIPTGSELTSRVENPTLGKVTETHSLLISRLVEVAGGVAKNLGIAKDDPREITRKLRDALRSCEIVLTMAGSSVGERDITADSINSLGRPGVLVHGVKVHRGRVMGLGAVRGKPIIILPGPIQGALNAFVLFAYPLVRSFIGRGFEEPPKIEVVLGADWEAKKHFDNFSKVVYLRVGRGANGFEAIPMVGETEKISLLTGANGYTIVPEEVTRHEKGDKIEAYLLPGFSFSGGSFLEY